MTFTLLRSAVGLAGALALAACGGGSGEAAGGITETPPPVAGADAGVPASAGADSAAFVGFGRSLANDDSAEPVPLGDFRPPQDDTGEPSPLG